MRWRVFGCGKRRSHAAGTCGLILCVALSIAPHRVAAADLPVIMDEAKLIRLPDKVATIVIGNPMIADVSLQPGGIMVSTGKGYGSTNVVVLDRAGAVLMEKSIEVQGPRAHVVVMYRGIERERTAALPFVSAGSWSGTAASISIRWSPRPAAEMGSRPGLLLRRPSNQPLTIRAGAVFSG